MEHRSLTFIVGLLFSALAVSAVAAYFSIVGLMAIFNGLPMSILAMGIVLEIAKLITASWIYQYWSRVKFMMKTYMVLAVIILSLITSVGIFGFLSKAHIEQSGLAGDAGAQVERIEQLIDREVFVGGKLVGVVRGQRFSPRKEHVRSLRLDVSAEIAKEYMRNEKIEIIIDIGSGKKSFHAYTMDLTKKYI